MPVTYVDPNRLFTIILPDSFRRDEEARSLVFRHGAHDVTVTVSCLRYEHEDGSPATPGAVFDELPSRESMQNIRHTERDGMAVGYGDYVGELQNRPEAWRWWTLQRGRVAVVVSVNGSPEAVEASRADVDALVEGVAIPERLPLSPPEFTELALDIYVEVLGEERPESPGALELRTSNGAKIRLDNAYAAYLDILDDEPDTDAREILMQMFEMLWGQDDENLDSFEHVQSMLYPVVRPWGFAVESKVPVISRPLLENELEILIALDTGRTLRFISREDLARWEGTSEDDLYFFARENLLALSEAIEMQVLTNETQDPKAVIIATGDSHDASRITLPSIYAKLSEVLGPELLVGIPNRDFMIVLAADEPELVANVAAQVKIDAQSRAYPISGKLYRLTQEGLTVA
jgi:uncharacterized protein YtpQ (UPF0354 family)